MGLTKVKLLFYSKGAMACTFIACVLAHAEMRRFDRYRG